MDIEEKIKQLQQKAPSSVKMSLEFAEWIDINGIRNGEHEWKYKGDNYVGKYTTLEMFEKWWNKRQEAFS